MAIRAPFEQAERLVVWLRRASDTPAGRLPYPREGHELSQGGEPESLVSRLDEPINRFDRWAKGRSSAPA